MKDRLAALALVIADQVQIIEQLRTVLAERDAQIAELQQRNEQHEAK